MMAIVLLSGAVGAFTLRQHSAQPHPGAMLRENWSKHVDRLERHIDRLDAKIDELQRLLVQMSSRREQSRGTPTSHSSGK